MTAPFDASAVAAPASWDAEFAALLEQLSTAQQQLLSLLDRKRQLIVRGAHAELSALQREEEALGTELQACHLRRQQLLARADSEGLPAESLAALNQSLPGKTALRRREAIDDAQRRAQLIRHECLAQWVAVQRSVLHLAHVLEIIATGGRQQPTYGKSAAAMTSGALIDQAV